MTLAFILIANQGNGSRTVQLSLNAQDVSADVAQLEILLDPQPLDTNQVVDPSESLSIDIPKVDLSSFLGVASTPVKGSNSSSDSIGGTVASTGGSSSESEVKAKPKSRVSFFGAEAYGNKFVFVIDSSGSMRGPRWQALGVELIRAIKSLSPDQEFFIISFDAVAHPMFGLDPPKGKFLNPTSKNITRVQNWIRSIQHGKNTLPSAAMGIAMNLKPDAIFLLSDGEIRDSTVDDLTVWNRKKGEDGYTQTLIPIHTVLLHSQIGYATLERIAGENSGTFTPVRPR